MPSSLSIALAPVLAAVAFNGIASEAFLSGGFPPGAVATPNSPGILFLQYCIDGLTYGSLIALIALGYTMVYGIVELINFAHGDVFMLGAMLSLSLAGWLGVGAGHAAGDWASLGAMALMLLLAPPFCAAVNVAIDRVVYKPLRGAPKLAPLVSAIGVSFILMNVGQLWHGAADLNFPELISADNLAPDASGLRFTTKDLLVVGLTVPAMIALTLFVKFTRLGRAMRATAQNPVAARLMGVDVDRVIAATFLIGGGLAGVASVVYCATINTVNWQMGFTTGLYAFTAAVLGGIGNIPGAVLGGLLIGLIRSLGSGYIDVRWNSAFIFAILIVVLIFRPTGLLGSRTREKV